MHIFHANVVNRCKHDANMTYLQRSTDGLAVSNTSCANYANTVPNVPRAQETTPSAYPRAASTLGRWHRSKLIFTQPQGLPHHGGGQAS